MCDNWQRGIVADVSLDARDAGVTPLPNLLFVDFFISGKQIAAATAAAAAAAVEADESSSERRCRLGSGGADFQVGFSN